MTGCLCFRRRLCIEFGGDSVSERLVRPVRSVTTPHHAWRAGTQGLRAARQPQLTHVRVLPDDSSQLAAPVKVIRCVREMV